MTWVRRLASLGPALLIADALILIGLFGVIVFVSQVRSEVAMLLPRRL